MPLFGGGGITAKALGPNKTVDCVPLILSVPFWAAAPLGESLVKWGDISNVLNCAPPPQGLANQASGPASQLDRLLS